VVSTLKQFLTYGWIAKIKDNLQNKEDRLKQRLKQRSFQKMQNSKNIIKKYESYIRLG
jgi:ElaB/YqjD/DUF883 family membrane-anchored ribosome-binding protein